MSDVIKNATFTSVWDGGRKITTSCKVNMETKEVTEIETVDAEGVNILEGEYVTIEGKDYSVSCTERKSIKTEFWYS